MITTVKDWAVWILDGTLYAIDTYPRVVAVLWPASLAVIVYMMWG